MSCKCETILRIASDLYGRPQNKKYTEDGTTYQFDYAYNNLGAPDTLTYPTSTAGVRFALKYVYDSTGYLNKVQDASTSAPFWTLTSANDSSAPELALMGNAVRIATDCTTWTNRALCQTVADLLSNSLELGRASDLHF